MTPPAELLDFIFAYPGLRQACHNYPDLLATYAPQLTIPGLGGEFEDTFDRFLENSMNRAADYYGKYPPKSGRAPLIMDDEIALHHHTLANCSPASLACQFVQGDIGGPPCRVYPNFDYAIWPLSSSSNWMPRRIRKVLTAGMKEWGVWHWTDSLTNIERELEIEPYDGMGAFMTTIWQKGARTPADFGDEARADLLARIGISKRLLSLPERAETLARRFLEAGFVEEYVRRHRQTLHAGGE